MKLIPVAVAVVVVFVVALAIWKFEFSEKEASMQHLATPADADRDPKLKALDELTIGCFGPQTVLEMSPYDQNLGGQCCGQLKSLHRYEEQINGLKAYAHIPEIPPDPYNISVALAQKLTNFDNAINLTAEQQKVSDEAEKMSHEGFCCCKCWKWYAHRGMSKYLITRHNFDAKQIASVLDLLDACGGEEHAMGVMHGA